MHIYCSRMHHSCIHYPNRKYQNLLSSHSSRLPLNLYSNRKSNSARLRSLNLLSMSQRIESHLNMHLASSISKDTRIHIHSDQMLTFFQCSRYFQEHIVPYCNRMLINRSHHSWGTAFLSPIILKLVSDWSGCMFTKNRIGILDFYYFLLLLFSNFVLRL